MKKNTPATKTGPNCDRLLAYIVSANSPTQAEMAEHMGLSTGAVQNLLNHLERGGLVERGKRSRTITVKATQ